MAGFLYRMPAGIAGDVQRREHSTIEPGHFDVNLPCLKYGILTKIVNNKYCPIAQGDVPANLKLGGFVVRPYPVQEPYGTVENDEAIGEGKPNVKNVGDFLKRGYMTIKVTANGATALSAIAKGDQVYVRTSLGNPPVGEIGDLEAGDTANNEPIPGAYFMGGVDSDGFAEIYYNI